MDRSLVGHALLAVAAAGLALVAWRTPRDTTDAQVVMVQGTSESLSRIRWQDEGYEVTLARSGEAVTVTTKALPKPPAVAEPATASVPPAEPKPARTFPGTEEATKLFGKLMPLAAGRSLGVLPDAKLETLGLTKPKISLMLQVGDNERVVTFGDTVYGTGDYYAQAGTGEVYLVPAERVAALRHGGGSLVDRNVTGVAEINLRRISVQGDGGRREFVQVPAPGGGLASYADASDPDLKLETAHDWLARLLRLRAVDQVEATPVGEPLLTVALAGDQDAPLASLKLYNHTDKLALAVTPRFALPITVSKSEVELLVREAATLIKEGK